MTIEDDRVAEIAARVERLSDDLAAATEASRSAKRKLKEAKAEVKDARKAKRKARKALIAAQAEQQEVLDAVGKEQASAQRPKAAKRPLKARQRIADHPEAKRPARRRSARTNDESAVVPQEAPATDTVASAGTPEGTESSSES